MSPQGHAWGSSAVRAELAAAQPHCRAGRAPAMAAATAGGGWPGDGPPPSRVSPHTGSFAVARWRAGAMQGSFLHYDLEEETDSSLFSHLKLILFLPLRGIMFESRASSADWVVFICFAEMFSWPKRQPPVSQGWAAAPGLAAGGCVAGATVNIIVLLSCMEEQNPAVRPGHGSCTETTRAWGVRVVGLVASIRVTGPPASLPSRRPGSRGRAGWHRWVPGPAWDHGAGDDGPRGKIKPAWVQGELPVPSCPLGNRRPCCNGRGRFGGSRGAGCWSGAGWLSWPWCGSRAGCSRGLLGLGFMVRPVGVIHTCGIRRQVPLCPGSSTGSRAVPKPWCTPGRCWPRPGSNVAGRGPKVVGEHRPHGAGGLLAAFSLPSALSQLLGEGGRGLHLPEQGDRGRHVLQPFLPWGPCRPLPSRLPSPPSSPFFWGESVVVELRCLFPASRRRTRCCAGRRQVGAVPLQAEMDVCS